MGESLTSVRPFGLQRTAAAIASNYGDDGAIIITQGPDGIRIGVHNLDADALKHVLCVAIWRTMEVTTEP